MQWISMKKELPQNSDWVLGLIIATYKEISLGGGVYQIRRIAFKANDYDKNEWMHPWFINDNAQFTHWMPFPNMPEE